MHYTAQIQSNQIAMNAITEILDMKQEYAKLTGEELHLSRDDSTLKELYGIAENKNIELQDIIDKHGTIPTIQEPVKPYAIGDMFTTTNGTDYEITAVTDNAVLYQNPLTERTMSMPIERFDRYTQVGTITLDKQFLGSYKSTFNKIYPCCSLCSDNT